MMRSTKPPPADLTGRVCVVTGASRGIGRAAAEQLGALGATLVLISRRAEDDDAVAEMSRVARLHSMSSSTSG